MKFDIIHFIGKSSCDFASHASQALTQAPACAPDQFWTMGAITLGLFVVVASAVLLRGRTHRRREDYLL